MHKRKKIGIIFIMVVIIILMGLGNLYSNPPQGKIQGTVRTEDGIPLAGVSVWLNKTEIKTTTNEKGTYSLTSNLTGSLLVTAYLFGFETETKTVQVDALPTLGEQDIFRSIQLMPGISASNESSAGLYVRGGRPDENLISKVTF